jgi:hypothetical protein
MSSAIKTVTDVSDTTVVIWDSRSSRDVARVYLLTPRGRRRRPAPAAIRRGAIQLVERLAAHPERPSNASVLLGDSTRAHARELDRRCLHLHGQ